MIYIGIDPGTHTGVAFWNSTSKELFDLYTLPIHRALEKVKRFYNDNKGLFDICVVFEDARQRKYAILEAEAEKESRIRKAAGEAEAIKKVA